MLVGVCRLSHAGGELGSRICGTTYAKSETKPTSG